MTATTFHGSKGRQFMTLAELAEMESRKLSFEALRKEVSASMRIGKPTPALQETVARMVAENLPGEENA